MHRLTCSLAALAFPLTALSQVGRPALVEDRCTDFAPLTSFLTGAVVAASGNSVAMNSARRDGPLSFLEFDAVSGSVLAELPFGSGTTPFVSGQVLANFPSYSVHALGAEGTNNLVGVWDRSQGIVTEVVLNGNPLQLTTVAYRTAASASLFAISPPSLIRISAAGAHSVTAPGLVSVAFLPSSREHAVALGSSVIFSGNNGAGRDPWISDGTSEGTFRLVDLPGSSPSFGVVAAGDRAFIVASISNAAQLWVTDGTSAGTMQISIPSMFVDTVGWTEHRLPVGGSGRVFWTGTAGLWTSDGTADGTHVVLPGSPLSAYRRSIVFDGHLYITVVDGGGVESMRRTLQDYSALEEVPWLPVPFQSGTGPSMFVTADRLYLLTDGPSGREVWRSDGTPQGTTQLVPDGPTGRFGIVGTPVVADDAIVFVATEPGIGQALYRADAAGLHRLALLGPEPDRSCGSGATPVASLPAGLVVRTSDNMLLRLERLGQPMMPLAQAAANSQFGVVNGILIFSGVDEAGAEPWRTDGTPEGTYRLADLYPGPDGSSPTNENAIPGLPAAGGWVYFRANTPTTGVELFRTDGTVAGTGLYRDINPGMASSTPRLVAWDDRLFAMAFGVAPANWRIWTDQPAGFAPLLPSGPLHALTSLFPTDHGIVHVQSNNVGFTDGTPEGTTVRVSIPLPGFSLQQHLATIGGKAVFRSGGSRLAFTDGTVEGSGLILGPDTPIADAAVEGNGAALGMRIVFGATDAATGNELWITDGQSAGTALLIDLNPGPAGSSPRVIHADGQRVMFMATTPGRGRELWISDGTAVGTLPIPEVADGPSGFAGTDTSPAVLVGSRLYFGANAGDGAELYVVPLCIADFDGDGTASVSDIFEFLKNYSAGVNQRVPVGADIDDDGQLTHSDIFGFLISWFSGCP